MTDKRESLYAQYLQEISGIKFTLREIEIISCIFNKKSTKKIASMLLISPRTVETHIHNIMIKIGINSKDRIVDFIEKSAKLRYVRQYYLGVLTQKLFETYLKKIASMQKQRIECAIETSDKSTVPQLQKDLKLANVLLTIHDKENSEPCIHVGSDKYSIGSMFQDTSASAYYAAVFDVLQKITNKADIAGDFQKEYDAIVFDNDTVKPTTNALQAPLKKTLALSMTIFPIAILCFFGLMFYTMGGSAISKNMTYSIRSDLAIPNKNVLLERPDIIHAMNKTFKDKKDGIKTIALTGIVGIGGAGKTTLARYYGRVMSDAKIVWELNAEKVESLISSFEDLAQGLAKKSSERQEKLDNILNIANTQEKHKQLLFIMKSWLKEDGSWLLIFDNVDNITDIKDYFPQDPKVWGQGNVIITTRNTNIQTNQYLAQSDIVKIEELTDGEKLTLFSKIYYDKLPDKDDIKKAVDFLKNIPPFPLDVSSAACYLKSTNTSFDQYIKNVQNPNIAFDKAQEALLKESGTYTKTRYNIITTSLQRMIDTRAEFADLALFIGLLDSQNIPKALLENYNKYVDEFIINLKKYSLITSEASSLVGPTFSIHRSTQAIILAYLAQKLDLSKNKEPLVKIANALENYMNAILDKEEYTKPKLLLDHYETFLSHNILSDDILGSMGAILGGMYCELDQHNKKTEQMLQNSLKKLEINKNKNIYKIAPTLAYLGITSFYLNTNKKGKNLLEQSIEIYRTNQAAHVGVARAMAYLGQIYRILGSCDKAKKLLEESIAIYQNHPKNYLGLARVLRYLGILYRDLGDYKKAKNLFEQSLAIYPKISDHVNIAFSMTYLGSVYRDLGDYEKAKTLFEKSLAIFESHHFEKYSPFEIGWTSSYLAMVYDALGDYDQAKNFLEKSFEIYINHYGNKGPHHVAWVSVSLGNVYRKLGDYEKAKKLIEHSLIINLSHFDNTHLHVGLNLLYLGKLYIDLGDYEKAKDYIDQSLAIYVKHYGKDHIQTAKALSALAEAYMLKPDMFEQAEKELLKAKGILGRENHPDIIIPLELLGDLYAKKADEKAKSIDFYKKALDMGSTYLPKNSVHITRLNKKLAR